jgi:hypothetical protein
MKTEQGAVGDSAIDGKPQPEASVVRGRRGKRRTSQASPSGGPLRFFLSKPESNGLPLLEQELVSESEAMLESLKTGRSYFVISEWKGAADLSKRIPQIRKESVPAKKFS